MITYTKLKGGEWGVRGPIAEVQVGQIVATKKSGQQKVETVRAVSKPFVFDGEQYVLGFLEGKRSFGGGNGTTKGELVQKASEAVTAAQLAESARRLYAGGASAGTPEGVENLVLRVNALIKAAAGAVVVLESMGLSSKPLEAALAAFPDGKAALNGFAQAREESAPDEVVVAKKMAEATAAVDRVAKKKAAPKVSNPEGYKCPSCDVDLEALPKKKYRCPDCSETFKLA